MSQKAY